MSLPLHCFPGSERDRLRKDWDLEFPERTSTIPEGGGWSNDTLIEMGLGKKMTSTGQVYHQTHGFLAVTKGSTRPVGW